MFGPLAELPMVISPFAFSPALQVGGLPKNRLLVQWIL
jgi:hypothetical protein